MFTNIELSGFSDEISPDFDQQLKVISQLGIKYIEIRGVDGKNISELTPQEVEQVKAKLDAAGVQVSSIGSPIGKISITDDFAPHLETFRQLLATAKVLQTRYIRMFSFYIPEGEDPACYRNEVLERLKVLIAEAEKADVVLLHENEKEIYGDTDLRCLDLMEQLACDHFQAVFDFANFVQCGVDTIKAYQRLKPYVAYIHIKDALSENGTVVPPGTGDGHLQEILAGFKSEGYTGFLSLEPHLINFTGLTSLENGSQQHVGVGAPTALTGEQAFTLAHDSLLGILEKI